MLQKLGADNGTPTPPPGLPLFQTPANSTDSLIPSSVTSNGNDPDVDTLPKENFRTQLRVVSEFCLILNSFP